jgi:VanZ family protein
MDWKLFMFSALAVLLTVGCLLPNSWLPAALPNDKLMHFAGFGLLALLALPLAHNRREGLWCLAGVLLASLAIECLQVLVPERHFCWRDLAANAAGVACAGLIGLAYGAIATLGAFA